MKKRVFLSASALAVMALSSAAVLAQDNTFKIGLVLPMTGQQASTGRQIEAAAKLFMAQNGDTVAGKKVQLNLSDGRNILVDKDGYRTGDTLLIGLPSQDIRKHLRLDKKAAIFLTGGKHLGHIGTVEGISGDRLMYRTEDGAIQETKREYAFVIGEGKPALTISASQDRKSQDNS